jgi:hypothetical protein
MNHGLQHLATEVAAQHGVAPSSFQ